MQKLMQNPDFYTNCLSILEMDALLEIKLVFLEVKGRTLTA